MLKTTSVEAKKIVLFYVVMTVPIYVLALIEAYLHSVLNLFNALVIGIILMLLVFFMTMFFYLPYVVNPRLKRDYGVTIDYLMMHGGFKVLEQLDENKKRAR